MDTFQIRYIPSTTLSKIDLMSKEHSLDKNTQVNFLMGHEEEDTPLPPTTGYFNQT